MDDPNAKSLALLESIETSDASIVVRLSKSPIDPLADQLLLSSITEADFLGYEHVRLELEPCAVPNNEWAEVASQNVAFANGEFPANQVIYFAYCTHTPPNGVEKLLQVYEFPEPIHVTAPYQEVSTGAWRFQQTD